MPPLSAAERRPCTWRWFAGRGAGDEVWTSTLTFAATANAIRYVGATPVFIDSERETWNMDPELLAEALRDAATQGRLPKALVAVDLYGQCADYERIFDACREHGVPVVEDAAEALGATYRGTAGRIVRKDEHALVQRKQDHHDERRRGACSPTIRPW